jgi:hypothetical protein
MRFLRFLLPLQFYSYERDSTPEEISNQLAMEIKPTSPQLYQAEFLGTPSPTGFSAIAPARTRVEFSPLSIWTFKSEDQKTIVRILLIPQIPIILLILAYFGWFGYLGVMAVYHYYLDGVTEDLQVPVVMFFGGWLLLVLGFQFLASLTKRRIELLMAKIE